MTEDSEHLQRGRFSKRARLKSCLRYKLQNTLLIAWSTVCSFCPSSLLSMPLLGLAWTGKSTLASLLLIALMLTVVLEIITVQSVYTALHDDSSSQTALTQPSYSWKTCSACIIISFWKEDRPWKIGFKNILCAVKTTTLKT